VLAEGEKQETLRVNGKPDVTARALFAAYQGSLLACRLFHTKVRLDEVTQTVKR
jgi:TetR/AcrR family transcriptional repressor of nem operon